MTFIEAHRRRFGVERLCQVMGLAPSTFYYRRARLGVRSDRQRQDEELTVQIRQIHERSRGTYGAPRVHAQLRRDGVRVARKRVERLMREANLKGAYLPRYFRTTISGLETRTAPDLVERAFHADAPNKLWVSDFTYIRTDQGFLFLACILDVFSRRIVGWSTSDAMTADLVHGALEMAVQNRDSRDARLIHHSDRGSQYSSVSFRFRLDEVGIRPSMGRKGDAYDNAMIESFFGTLKIELLYRQRWHTRHDAEMAIFSYIEGFYNTRRLHSCLDYRSPAQYEDDHQRALATTGTHRPGL